MFRHPHPQCRHLHGETIPQSSKESQLRSPSIACRSPPSREPALDFESDPFDLSECVKDFITHFQPTGQAKYARPSVSFSNLSVFDTGSELQLQAPVLATSFLSASPSPSRFFTTSIVVSKAVNSSSFSAVLGSDASHLRPGQQHLDSFDQALRISSNMAIQSHAVAIYQASQAIYNEFDKATVLYEGRQIYFGPTPMAKSFLNVRAGMELKIPSTGANLPEYNALLEEREYDERKPEAIARIR
ncbi:hypothetical protein GE21DRAFT_6776 [Neurospora crassa]|uniref:Pleiotropic ABC efflux transporter N-terminal domain-containing protein n=1 Tax=Neurospora crassa (strain ATCC 24698 / 74-OR23-1A / CBS 708.71 / DSM 1257 / FGSC 987) TaxID=367110 RepID=V5IPM6_NEUCR|nr:hypothetical protein NCU05166 [Neurospora crassa OR74A]ESA43109.1 hypothetical protein NCU05166 [Neurospora crassa OR74A]KHE79069.1 hypothetical protein GE21DRAFT_6776 [Neurospora crassa]|eukprot:XP_011394124.1 hypothetical protein NCU05166 [Neurospora crassa OR74A]